MWAIVRGIDSPVAVFVVHRRQRAIVTCVVTCVRFSVKANPAAGAYASTAEQSDAVRSVVISPPCSMCRSLHFWHHRSIVAEVRPCCNAYARSGRAKSCGVTPTHVAALGAAPSSSLPANGANVTLGARLQPAQLTRHRAACRRPCWGTTLRPYCKRRRTWYLPGSGLGF